MAGKTFPLDANGREVRSASKKWVAPEPNGDHLTAVWVTGVESLGIVEGLNKAATDYVYVDAVSLLEADVAVARLRAEEGKLVKSKLQQWKCSKFVRDLVNAGYDMWPVGGYLTATLARLGVNAAAEATAVAAPPPVAAVAVPDVPPPPAPEVPVAPAPAPVAETPAEPDLVPGPDEEPEEDAMPEPVAAPAAPPVPPAPPVAPAPAADAPVAPVAPPVGPPPAPVPAMPPGLPGLPTA